MLLLVGVGRIVIYLETSRSRTVGKGYEIEDVKGHLIDSMKNIMSVLGGSISEFE